MSAFVRIKPYAAQHHWPAIACMFRAGLDTHAIATELRLSEAAVANALTDALRSTPK